MLCHDGPPPHPALPLPWAALPPPLVQPLQTPTGDFGTRSQVALVVWRGGRAELRERYLDPADRQWREVRHEFQVEASETR